MTRWKRAMAASVLCGALLANAGWAAAPQGDAAGRVNLNTASPAELAKLPGIGPAKAMAIVEHRAREPFVSPDDLKKVKGIGQKLYDSIREQITVGEAPSPKGRGS